mmetsp:Transcript_106329/g.300834  ORF Transcript_106329/g.300834 Transcript_106329/m.300834 type:complete len:325 (+) Transcript_106329:1150-2124(+)
MGGRYESRKCGCCGWGCGGCGWWCCCCPNDGPRRLPRTAGLISPVASIMLSRAFTIDFARSTHSGGPAKKRWTSPSRPGWGPCRMSRYVPVTSFRPLMTCQWSPLRRWTLLGSTGMMSVTWPMPEWSPSRTRSMRSTQAATRSQVPKIFTCMLPTLVECSLSLMMWHFITPLVCRIFSMVWPCSPRRWPFLRAGMSITFSSFGPSGSKALSAEPSPAPVAPRQLWTKLSSTGVPLPRAASNGFSTSVKLLGSDVGCCCGWYCCGDRPMDPVLEPGPRTSSSLLPGAAMKRSISWTAPSTRSGWPAMKSRGVSFAPFERSCWISM